MLATTWLREHSRIVGLLCAFDLEMSQHNPWYRVMTDLFSHPQKAIADFKQAIVSMKDSGPSFQIKFFEGAPQTEKPATTGKVFNSASGNEALSQTPTLGNNKQQTASPLVTQTAATVPAVNNSTAVDNGSGGRKPASGGVRLQAGCCAHTHIAVHRNEEDS